MEKQKSSLLNINERLITHIKIVSTKKQKDTKGMEQVEKIIFSSIERYAEGIKAFKKEQLENLKEFCEIDKKIIESKIKAIDKLIEEKCK
jgi:hypothetical protein